jgi:hypothetical protein
MRYKNPAFPPGVAENYTVSVANVIPGYSDQETFTVR